MYYILDCTSRKLFFLNLCAQERMYPLTMDHGLEFLLPNFTKALESLKSY